MDLSSALLFSTTFLSDVKNGIPSIKFNFCKMDGDVGTLAYDDDWLVVRPTGASISSKGKASAAGAVGLRKRGR
jgi:hypothetical protein